MGTHEVCDVVDVSQFLPGHSAYECVAYAAALLKFAGKPGQGPSGSALQVSNLAQYWYGREEGGNDAANKSGMSLLAMEDMLTGMGLSYQSLAENLGTIRATIEHDGLPIILCGHEGSFYDMELGDHIPYNWTPTGNHAIVVSGIDPVNGNLLVHDCANVDRQGRIRPGPRMYDASKIELVSVTSVRIGEDMTQPLTIDMPAVADIFRQLDANHWQSKATGRILQFGLLENYKANGLASITYLGDVQSPEIDEGASVVQYHTHGARRWVKSTGKVEPLDLFNPGAPNLPRIAPPNAPVVLPQDHAALLQIKDIVSHF